MKVGISALKSAIGAYVDHAAAGGTVVIMRRGKPVAKLVRLPKAEAPAPCGSCRRVVCVCPTLLDEEARGDR